MTAVLIVIHLILAIAMIGIILLQQSEGGLGGLGGGSGMSGFMTGRATANMLTRVTAALAGLFFLTSLSLAVLAEHGRKPASILDTPGRANQGQNQGTGAPAPTVPQLPVPPSQ